MPPKQPSIDKRDREQQVLRKKPQSTVNPAAAAGILRALDPQLPQEVHGLQREYSDEFPNDHSSREEGKKEKKSFWERATKDRGGDKERDKEKDKERHREKDRKEDEAQVEITRMIGARCPNHNGRSHS